MKQLKILILAAIMAAFFMPALVQAESCCVDVPILIASQDEKGVFKDWNKGEVHGWIKGVNPKAVTYLQVAQIYLDEQGLSEQWQIINPLVANVEKFTLKRFEIKEGKNVTPSPQLVEVQHEALRIKVEPLYQQVTVYHHLERQGQAVLVETTEMPFPRNTLLDAARIPEDWILKKYVDLQNDPSKTVVSPINQFDKSLGQYVFKGWVVDLYYSNAVASPAPTIKATSNNYHVDAAKQAIQLPATGAVSNALLMIGSAAMVILGLVGKRS